MKFVDINDIGIIKKNVAFGHNLSRFLGKFHHLALEICIFAIFSNICFLYNFNLQVTISSCIFLQFKRHISGRCGMWMEDVPSHLLSVTLADFG